MKKLILTAAILLGSLTTISAQEQTQDETTVPVETTTPETQSAPTEEATPSSDEFTEIKLEEVPTAVTDALKKAFPDATLSKASVNGKKEYQLEVKVGDKEGALYADETGKWIEK